MVSLARIIQALIIISTVLGVFFLLQVQPPILPAVVFESLVVGWFLFLIDSILTFVRPRLSIYLGIVLAVVALGATLSQPTHFQLVASGNIAAAATIILGSGAEILLVLIGGYFVMTDRKKDPWAWPGKADASAPDDGSEQAG
jgi:hypothetical protein